MGSVSLYKVVSPRHEPAVVRWSVQAHKRALSFAGTAEQLRGVDSVE